MSRALVRGLALALVAGGLAAGPARAQQLEGRAVASQMAYRFRDSTGSTQQAGPMLGASLAVGFGKMRLAASGFQGRVVDADHAFAERELRATTLSLGLQAADWIEVGVEAQARRESMDGVVTLQRVGGPFAKTAFNFGDTGFQGLAELALYPASSSSNTPPLQLALRAGIGARYQQMSGPFTIQLMYRFNRFDYKESGGVQPLTQDEAVSLEVGLRKF